MSECTALAKPFHGLTVGDVLLLELPHVPEEHREDIAWEFTGWPCFFAPDPTRGEWHPSQVFRRQLAEFRQGKR